MAKPKLQVGGTCRRGHVLGEGDIRPTSAGRPKEFEVTEIERSGQWEVLPSKNDPTGKEWRAEYIDYADEGKCYVAIFSGPDSEKRAREYVALVAARYRSRR